MSNQRKKPPSQRQMRVAQEVKFLLSQLFARRDYYDPNTGRSIDATISYVSVSPDLKRADIHVVPMGGRVQSGMIEALEGITPQIRAHIARQMHLRHTPQLYFRLDEHFNRVQHLEDIMHSPKVQGDLDGEGGDE